MSELIIAQTKLDPVYPGYINVTRLDNGGVGILMRGDPKSPANHPEPGETVSLSMSESEWHAIVFALAAEVSDRERKLGRPVPPHGSGP